MDIFQIFIRYYPIWSSREIIVIVCILLSSSILAVVLLRAGKIKLSQAISGMLLMIYLLLVIGSTVFTRTPKKRQYQLELFWSWKEIIKPIGRTGAMTNKGLLLENLLNMVLLSPAGLLLPIAYHKKVKWYHSLVFGLVFSGMIEICQLIFCRGLFEFDDIIHNGIGCLAGTLLGNLFLSFGKRT